MNRPVRLSASTALMLSLACLALLATLLLPLPALARVRQHTASHATIHRRLAAASVPSAPGQAMFLLDSDTGLILAQDNPDAELHPASLTKTMTLLLTFEALDQGRLHIRDGVPVSSHAADMMPSKLGLRPGSSIALEDAIYIVAVHSANDIAVALAEKIGGSEPGFVAMMNRRAAQLGMTHTHFINASGLHNPVQVSSARDMAILAHYIIQAHPQYYHYFATRNFIYHGVLYQNHNHLMETYAGMDGLKTGFIQQSGFNLIASAHRGPHRLIGVIFGGRSTASRNAQMATLLDWGFAHDDAANAAARARQVAMAAPRAVQAQGAPQPVMAPQTVVQQAVAQPVVTQPGMARAGQPPAQGTLDGVIADVADTGATGQGDSDAAADSRPVAPAPAVTSLSASPSAAGGWAVQLGAYDSPAKSGALLNSARSHLPPALQGAQPQSVPLQTANGWLYRARLTGYSQGQAFAACQLLADCIPVPPAAN